MCACLDENERKITADITRHFLYITWCRRRRRRCCNHHDVVFFSCLVCVCCACVCVYSSVEKLNQNTKNKKEINHKKKTENIWTENKYNYVIKYKLFDGYWLILKKYFKRLLTSNKMIYAVIINILLSSIKKVNKILSHLITWMTFAWSRTI